MGESRRRIARLLLQLQAVDVFPGAVRKFLLRRGGVRMDPTAFVEAGTTIIPGTLELGAHSYINRNCFIDAAAGVVIGAGTLLGPGVKVLTTTHAIQAGYPRAGPTLHQPVRIGRGVWIGATACILPGTVIGDGCVVGAAALVRGELFADGLYLGVPATRSRDLAPPA